MPKLRDPNNHMASDNSTITISRRARRTAFPSYSKTRDSRVNAVARYRRQLVPRNCRTSGITRTALKSLGGLLTLQNVNFTCRGITRVPKKLTLTLMTALKLETFGAAKLRCELRELPSNFARISSISAAAGCTSNE